MKVRERAGCSLAKSGMLTRGQRLKAIPGLIDLADDPSLEPVARKWLFQALREITDVALPDDPDEWRYRHSEGWDGSDSEPWPVRGNS